MLTLLDDTAKFIVSALSRLAAVSKLVRVRVESSKNRLTTFLPRSAGTFGMDRCEISTMWSVSSSSPWMSAAERSSIDSRCFIAITTPVGADLHVLVAGGRQVLADVVGADRQLPMTAIDDDGELHGVRPAVLVERLQRGAHGAAGEQHVVDEDHRGAVERHGDRGDVARHDRPQADVVAMEADVERADRHGLPDAGQHCGQLVGDPHPTALQPDQHDAVGAVVAFDDLVGDAGERPADVVGAQDLSRSRRCRHDFLPRIGLTGPISRSALMIPAVSATL